MANQDYIYVPNLVAVQFAAEPTLNAYESLSLLASQDYLSGMNQWVYKTAAELPQKQRRDNDLFLRYMWLSPFPPVGMNVSFPVFVDKLTQYDPFNIRDRSLEHMAHKLEHYAGEKVTPDMLLSDQARFMAAGEKFFDGKKDKGMAFNEELYLEAFRLYNEPQELLQRLVAHLRTMWEEVLEPEWKRTQPMLLEAVEAYTQMEYPEMSPVEAVRVITGRDISNLDWGDWGERIEFVPSPHIGPYIAHYMTDDKTLSYLMFGLRLPQGSRYQSPALTRSELNVRLDALADDTRLRILEACAQQGELCSQDIITLLNLTQSATSRNLRQLVATGFLVERVQGNAKCYAINRERFEDTLRALRRFIRTTTPNWLAI
jgi:DNA-binding transcriptional ArsR family regulator